MPKGSLTRRAYETKIPGKTTRGRPRKKLEDGIEEDQKPKDVEIQKKEIINSIEKLLTLYGR